GRNVKEKPDEDDSRPWFKRDGEKRAERGSREDKEDRKEEKPERPAARKARAMAAKGNWKSSEKKLLTPAQTPYVVKGSIRVSPDRRRVAIFLFKSGTPGYQLVLDGKVVTPPDSLIASS